jgi:hypothetical protein
LVAGLGRVHALGRVDVPVWSDGRVRAQETPGEGARRRCRGVPAPGSSAVVDDVWADKVQSALVKSDKRINKAIDLGDYDELQKALAKSDAEVSDAITT